MIPHSIAKFAGLVLKVSVMYYNLADAKLAFGLSVCVYIVFNILYIMTVFVSGVQREILQIALNIHHTGTEDVHQEV